MPNPIVDVGTAIFAFLMVVMTVSAGVAALAPARDHRVLIGALILVFAWLFVVIAIYLTGSRRITSSLWTLDLLYAAGYYWLSKPSTRLSPFEQSQINWASYVVAVFGPMVVLEICRHLYLYDHWYQMPVAAILLGIVVVILFGLIRGFGWKASAIYMAAVVLIFLASLISYNSTLNFLTYSVIAIITSAALRGCRVNLRAWVGNLREQMRN